MLQVCECSKALNCFATPPGGLFWVSFIDVRARVSELFYACFLDGMAPCGGSSGWWWLACKAVRGRVWSWCFLSLFRRLQKKRGYSHFLHLRLCPSATDSVMAYWVVHVSSAHWHSHCGVQIPSRCSSNWKCCLKSSLLPFFKCCKNVRSPHCARFFSRGTFWKQSIECLPTCLWREFHWIRRV